MICCKNVLTDDDAERNSTKYMFLFFFCKDQKRIVFYEKMKMNGEFIFFVLT